MLSIIGTVLKYIFVALNIMLEKNKEVKAKKKEILKEAKDGIKNKDSSAIASAYDRINRL